jgi:prevent-host-death family protein
MKTVSARQANQEFSRLLAAAAAGEEFVITRHGTPVAKLVPVARPLSGADRDAAVRRMVKLMKKGIPGLGGVWPGKDYAHEL